MEKKMLKRLAADFTTPRLLRDAAEVTIPRLLDDAGYAAEVDLLTSFRDRAERLEREKQRLDLENYFVGKSPDPKSPQDSAMRARLALLRADPPLTPVTSPSPAAPSPTIAAGIEVLAGKPVAPPPDHRAKIQEIDRQITALKAAIMEQTEVCERITGELTLEYATRLRPAWNQLQVEMFRAAQELARSAKRVREFRSAITAAGIQSRSDILAMPNVRAPLMLGDESVYDSEISTWRRILERLEILG
jgi:hypothetical protein